MNYLHIFTCIKQLPTMKRFLCVLFIAVFALVSCKEKEGKEEEEFVAVAVSSVSLDKTEITMTEGDKEVLSVTVLPENAFNKSVKWSSSDESVASVHKGEVTAKKEGSAVITVASEDGGKEASCVVNVEAKIIYATSVSLSEEYIEMMVGDEVFMSFDIYPPESVHGTPHTWSSDNGIADYGDGGMVRAYSEGTATIYLSVEAGPTVLTDECVVKVTPRVYPVESISLDKTEVTMYVGNTEKLSVTILPSNATNKNFTWATSDNRFVSIDDDGTIKALMAGSATITATTEDGNKKATCEVTVKGNDQYVDLGLSVDWCSCNLGSDTPEGYGDYYAWGEVETYYIDGDAQKSRNEVMMKNGKSGGYTWDNYKYYDAPTETFTKYVIEYEAAQWGKDGFYDNKRRLDPEDDVVRRKKLDGGRMPTEDEFNELISGCYWSVIELNGVLGFKFRSKISDDKWIFLPAAGYREGMNLENLGTYGYYWASDIHFRSNPETPHGVELFFNRYSPQLYGTPRCNGNTIRPVRDK